MIFNILFVLARIIVFSLSVAALSCVGAAFTTWNIDEGDIQAAYEREVNAIRLVSVGEEDDEFLPIEIRANTATAYVEKMLANMKAPTAGGIIEKFLTIGKSKLPTDWFNRYFKPRMILFAPTLYIRIEVYITIYLLCVPWIFFCYYCGEYFARKSMREGKHKRNTNIAWCFRGLQGLTFLGLLLLGFVFMFPIVYWIVPSIICSGLVIALIRANSIEIK